LAKQKSHDPQDPNLQKLPKTGSGKLRIQSFAWAVEREARWVSLWAGIAVT
jgi:hypothetical protein